MNLNTFPTPVVETEPSFDTISNDHKNFRSTWDVMFLALVFLISAHLSVKEFFPNPALWVIGAGFIVVAGVIWLMAWKDDFGFLMVMFVCVHFAFADTQGGLWSYIVCAVFIIASLLDYRKIIFISSIPLIFQILIYIIIIQQFAGTILNQYSYISNIQATIVTVSQILIFYYSSSQKITNLNLKRLLSVGFMVICWMFVIGLNQHFHWVITSSPLLPTLYRKAGIVTSIPLGPFGNSELFSEYFCIVFVLSLVIISHLKELRSLHINIIGPILIVLIAPIALILGTSRAAIILAVTAICFILFSNLFILPSFCNIKRTFVLTTLLFLAVASILMVGSLVSLDAVKVKFSKLNPSKININTVANGKGINRDAAYKAAYRRLDSKSWWLGYGYNLPENNLISMGLRKDAADYHSLYLSLPIYYGWLGAASYVLLIVGTVFRSYICYVRYRKFGHLLVPITLGLAVIWCVYLLDQYKITVTRNHSYYLLTWLWLGITHAVINSLHQRNIEYEAHSKYEIIRQDT